MQVAWSRQQDQELAALNRTVSRVQALSSGSDATIAQDYVEGEFVPRSPIIFAILHSILDHLESMVRKHVRPLLHWFSF